MKNMARRVFSVILLLALVCSSFPTAVVFGANLPQVWVESSLRTVYRTSEKLSDAKTSIELVMAKNEYEGAQIVLRSSTGFTINSLELPALSNGEEVISADNLHYNFVDYYNAETSKTTADAYGYWKWADGYPLYSDWADGVPTYTEKATPDPLSADISRAVQANKTQPVYITVYTPESTEPGTYTGVIKVKTSEGDINVPISAEVNDVTIPALQDATVTDYLWTYIAGFMWDDTDYGLDYFGHTPYSPQWWNWFGKMAEIMAEHRQNMTWIRTDLLLKATGTDWEDFAEDATTPEDSQIDWSIFDRYVQTLIDVGFTRFANFQLNHKLDVLTEDDKDIDKWLSNFLGAFYRHLEDKGWLDQYTWYQHVADEPSNPEKAAYWFSIAKKIKPIMPKVRTFDAEQGNALMKYLDNHPEDNIYIDTWVPLSSQYENRRNDYQAQQTDKGKEFWMYTCDANPEPWLNRFWTQPTLTGRLLYWNLFQNGATGHLHWAWNAWYGVDYGGDTYLVYPDPANDSVLSSVRYEAHRDGIEDYELLNLLKANNPQLAKAVTDLAVYMENPRGQYSFDPEYIKALHDYIVRSAAGRAVDMPEPTGTHKKAVVDGYYYYSSSDPSIQYSGGWTKIGSEFAYAGTIKRTTTVGSSATLTFEGQGIDVMVEKNKYSGPMKIELDNRDPFYASGYESSDYYFFNVFSAYGLSEGQHTIRITNIEEGKRVSLNCLRIKKWDGQVITEAPFLEDLQISGISDLGFASEKTDYGIILDAGIEKLTIKAVLKDPNNKIKINGVESGSGELVMAAVPQGAGEIVIETSTPDEAIKATYKISVVKNYTAGNNMALSYATVDASAKRSDANWGPAKAVDGNLGTQYASDPAYTRNSPFPHTFDLTWNSPVDFNTIVIATASGQLQGISNADIQVKYQGASEFTTVAQSVSFDWKHGQDDGIIEYAPAILPQITGAVALRLLINDANYTMWSMYGTYELGLYNLAQNGQYAIQSQAEYKMRDLKISRTSDHSPVDLAYNPFETEYSFTLYEDDDSIDFSPTLAGEDTTVTFENEDGDTSVLRDGDVLTAFIPEGTHTLKLKVVDGSNTKTYTLDILRYGRNFAKDATISVSGTSFAGSSNLNAWTDGDYKTNGIISKINPVYGSNLTIGFEWNTPVDLNKVNIVYPKGLGTRGTNPLGSLLEATCAATLNGGGTTPFPVGYVWIDSYPGYTDANGEDNYIYSFPGSVAASNVRKLEFHINGVHGWSDENMVISEFELFNIPEATQPISFHKQAGMANLVVTALSDGHAIDIGYDPDVKEYSIALPASENAITLTPVLTGSGTALTVRDGNGDPVAVPRRQSVLANIPEGEHTISITVSSDNGTTVYSLNVSREFPNLAKDAAISISGTYSSHTDLQALADGDYATAASVFNAIGENPSDIVISFEWDNPVNLNTADIIYQKGLPLRGSNPIGGLLEFGCAATHPDHTTTPFTSGYQLFNERMGLWAPSYSGYADNNGEQYYKFAVPSTQAVSNVKKLEFKVNYLIGWASIDMIINEIELYHMPDTIAPVTFTVVAGS